MSIKCFFFYFIPFLISSHINNVHTRDGQICKKYWYYILALLHVHGSPNANDMRCLHFWVTCCNEVDKMLDLMCVWWSGGFRALQLPWPFPFIVEFLKAMCHVKTSTIQSSMTMPSYNYNDCLLKFTFWIPPDGWPNLSKSKLNCKNDAMDRH